MSLGGLWELAQISSVAGDWEGGRVDQDKRARGWFGDHVPFFEADWDALVGEQDTNRTESGTYSRRALKPSSSDDFNAPTHNSTMSLQLWSRSGIDADNGSARWANSRKLGARLSCLQCSRDSWKWELLSWTGEFSSKLKTMNMKWVPRSHGRTGTVLGPMVNERFSRFGCTTDAVRVDWANFNAKLTSPIPWTVSLGYPRCPWQEK